jgi:hypothetical protein
MLALLEVWRISMYYAIAPRVMGHELEIHPRLAIFTLMVAALRVIHRRFASSQAAAPLRDSFANCPETRRETSLVASG